MINDFTQFALLVSGCVTRGKCANGWSSRLSIFF